MNGVTFHEPVLKSDSMSVVYHSLGSRKIFASAYLSLMALLWTLSAEELRGGGTFEFFENHCIKCHDEDSKKGGLDLTAVSRKLGDAQTFDRWVAVFVRSTSRRCRRQMKINLRPKHVGLS